MFYAAGTARAFAGASALGFGVEAWATFFGAASVGADEVLRKGGSDWSKLQSFYAFSHQIAGGYAASLAVHVAVSLAAAAATVLIWLRGTTLAVKSAAVVAASCLVT